MQKQRGYIVRAGDWWYIKYRDTVIDTDPESPTYNLSASSKLRSSSRSRQTINGSSDRPRPS